MRDLEQQGSADDFIKNLISESLLLGFYEPETLAMENH